jgi:hypothetical protein
VPIETVHAAVHWLATGEVGASSQSLLFLALNWSDQTELEPVDVPVDDEDLLRCMNMLEAVPGIHERFDVVAAASSAWNPFIENWSLLMQVALSVQPSRGMETRLLICALLRESEAAPAARGQAAFRQALARAQSFSQPRCA